MNTNDVINYSSIINDSGLGDIAHLIHGVFLVGAAVMVVFILAVVAYKIWKGDI